MPHSTRVEPGPRRSDNPAALTAAEKTPLRSGGTVAGTTAESWLFRRHGYRGLPRLVLL